MLILGMLILVGVGVVGTAGVLGNRGAGHRLPGGFDVLGHSMHGSSGQLFFWGIALGAVTVIGVILVLAGLRSGVKRRGTARRDARWRRRGEQQARSTDGEAIIVPEQAAIPEPQPAEDNPAKA
jgi:hypothetical protein